MQNKLTRREKDIFNLLLDGAVPKEIAGKLNISYETVVSHQKRLYRKLKVHSIDELFEKYKKEEHLFSTDKSKPPVIFLEDGTFFTVPVINEVHLRVNRWVNKAGDAHGENYHTGKQIRLKDIYNGTIDNLIPNPDIHNLYRVRVSGTVNKRCNNMKIYIHYFIKYDEDWIALGSTSDDKHVSVGPGKFSKILTFRHEGIDITTLPKGGIILFCLHNQLLIKGSNYIFDSGERIPADMPIDSIWATIKNLKIEPLDRLATNKEK